VSLLILLPTFQYNSIVTLALLQTRLPLHRLLALLLRILEDSSSNLFRKIGYSN